MKWEVLESEYLHKEEWLTVRKDKCRMPNGEVIPAFYVNEYPEWVNAFALTEDGKVVMVKQYRHGIEKIAFELPGGVVEKGEEPEEAVKREMKEETGYEFDTWEYLGKICANASTTNNYMHMFLAKNGRKTMEPSLDTHEDLEVHIMEVAEVKKLVKENKILQSLHVNNIFYALNRIEEMNY